MVLIRKIKFRYKTPLINRRGVFEVNKDYSNFKASPSNDSSATLIESVGQPSNASIISSINTSGISTIPWLSSNGHANTIYFVALFKTIEW